MKLTELVNENKVNFLVYGIGQAFNLVSPIVVAPYIISICGIDSFGKVGLGFALSLFLILIVDYSFDIKGTQNVSENRKNTLKLQEILFNTLYAKCILVVIAYLIAIILIFTIPLFESEKPLFLFSFLIVLAQVFNPVWFLQGVEDFKLSSVINILSKLTYLLLIFSFITSSTDYIFVNLFLGLSALIFNLIGIVIILKRYKFIFLRPDVSTLTNILKRDFSFCISQLFLSLRQLSPLFVTSYFFGFNIAGQYKVIEQIISFFRTLIQVYLKYFFPRLCYTITVSDKQAIDFWKRYKLLLLTGVIFSLTVIYFSAPKIIEYFNIDSIKNSNLIYVMRLALIVPLLMVFTLGLEQLMFAFSRNSKYIQITILVTIINVSLLFLFAPLLNLYGVIISIIISEFCFAFLYF